LDDLIVEDERDLGPARAGTAGAPSCSEGAATLWRYRRTAHARKARIDGFRLRSIRPTRKLFHTAARTLDAGELGKCDR